MSMETLSLNGPWTVQKNGGGKKLPGTVPGDVYGDLLTAGEIPDPFYRDNELDLQWIGETDWTYTRTFTVSEQLLSKEHVLLRCDGLDTFAKVTVNDQAVAETDNMFRTYEWDVKGLLELGKNTIRIDFTSVLPYIRERQKAYPRWTPFAHSAGYAGWVRKEQCNFGWDWGIRAVTCGIWRDIQIVAFDQARLTHARISQHHSEERVDLELDVAIDGVARGLTIEASVTDGPMAIVAMKGKKGTITLVLDNPKLWWPNGMGEQHLHTVSINLKAADGTVIDGMTKRIGLRTLELDRHDDQWGESFQFVVNGVPFFAKGANWIPVDAVLARRTPNDYRRLVQAAADCNMNMLRVWGGGIYEDDVFYDLCDELGICVWQDFMFACSAYPTFQKGFMANVKAEARDAIGRLRHHPCMALWCGNNELEMMNVGDDGWDAGKMPWAAYKKLFDELLPKQVADLSPDIPYWPSSPHSPTGDRSKHRNHECGDAHLWIMGARYPLDCARGMDHRFASEFGFQSFPEPKTIAAFTRPEDRNVSSRIMELHQRSPMGNTDIINKLLQCFRMPNGSDGVLWISQILQGAGVKGVCEHFRRNMPRCMGALYWQINDCWPVASWASIDFFGRWKAMQYMARHFFDSILISGVDNPDTDTVEIHLTSDKSKALNAVVCWTVTDAYGSILIQDEKKTKTPCNGSRLVKTLSLKKLLATRPRHDVIVWLEVDVDARPTRRNVVFLSPPKHLELSPNPGIESKIERNADGAFSVKLKSKRIALWTWLELEGIDATYSDNFFHLGPGQAEEVLIRPKKRISLEQLESKLTVRSLVDTYR